ncbi:MAG: pentapeptide repeat-containing protein [Anaerolineae bacterium]|nr:pentapeptide repeat-containing protein [Anaerolineae bacterium]
MCPRYCAPAELAGADLSSADLIEANLHGTTLSRVKRNEEAMYNRPPYSLRLSIRPERR